MTFSSFFLAAAMVSAAVATSLQVVSRQANAANPNGPLPGWSFVGCFSDNNLSSRTLQEHSNVNPAMTPAVCTRFCGNFTPPLNFAGAEFTSQCFCDFNIQGTATRLNNTACNSPCGGDPTLTCGGANKISIWQNNNAGVGPIPTNKAIVGNWLFNGCFTDVVGGNPRTLQFRFFIPGGITIESCTTQCQTVGFNISGLEFGQQCWCGNSFSLPVANITAPISDCSRACRDDPTELCGASRRLSVYTLKLPV